MKRNNWKRKRPLFILLAGGAILAAGGATMLLWNGILPAALHTGTISFWQATGMLVLGRLLFGGMRGRGHGRGMWKHRMQMKWQSMTPEERERFASRMHCGRGFRDNATSPIAE